MFVPPGLPVRSYLFCVGDLTTGQAELARRVKQPASKLSFLEPLPPELLRNICASEILEHLESSGVYGRGQKLD